MTDRAAVDELDIVGRGASVDGVAERCRVGQWNDRVVGGVHQVVRTYTDCSLGTAR